MEDMRAVQLEFADERAGSPVLGDIYIGKVKDIAKNISAAFVDLGNGSTGYYSLEDNPVHNFADEVSPAQARRLRPGDEIIVQVAREAVRSKDMVLSAKLSFTGRFCVLIAGGPPRVSFSSKIADEAWKKEIAGFLAPEMEPSFGLIVRTNACGARPEQIREELLRLKETYRAVMDKGRHRTCFSLLYEAPPSYVGRIRDAYSASMEEILTDDEEIFRTVREYLRREQPDDADRLRFYSDPLVPLSKLYSLEKAAQEALQKKVWLRSGGYLVIEPTEAMTVIDVNTGKFTGRKLMRDTVRAINLEAAREIARQLRLRNLSGIILVDFINMSEAEDRGELMRALASCCAEDPVRTSVVDMTKLDLVEITRKKVRKPFYEQWGGTS